MADAANPQTPPRKLFKASSKTKTPTPVKKLRPSTPTLTPSSAQSQTKTSNKPGDSTGQGNPEASRSAGSLYKPVVDDIAKSTTLAPLTSAADVASGKVSNYAGSDTTGDTPIGLVDNDVFTPTDTVSRSTGAAGALSRNASETQKGAQPNLNDEAPNIGEGSETPTEAPSSVFGELTKKTSGAKNDILDQSTDSVENTTGNSKNVLDSTNNLSEQPSNPTDALSSSTDIAKYFVEHGIPEMGKFVETLAGKALEDTAGAAGNPVNATKSVSQDPASTSSNSINTEQGGSEKPIGSASQAANQDRNLTNQTPDVPKPADVSRKMNGATRGGISRKAVNAGKGAPSDDTQVVDNMGKPAHIERTIEIPLERPEKVVSSPAQSHEPDIGDNGAALGDANDLPTTENLPSTDDLPDVSDDPPEEVLDPSVHSASTSITPIPKIPKIPPIGMIPPPDLSQLARGLGGNTVDDIGNIVDKSGKVLGHATGDLPAMVGKKVAESGEVYGDNEEVIGYVSENFTESPPAPTPIPSNFLRGLKVDHEGNILGPDGNIVGRFNQKPGETGGLPPNTQSNQSNQSNQVDSDPTEEEEKPPEEKPAKANAQKELAFFVFDFSFG
ncbi:hypothetical protein F4779DRAFT_631269 [Xylariaceae sp. FL0662B]|nr:hypothetical protein F4779DRAFT_631269 [Xylariaceae sp. FL0662B]